MNLSSILRASIALEDALHELKHKPIPYRRLCSDCNQDRLNFWRCPTHEQIRAIETALAALGSTK